TGGERGKVDHPPAPLPQDRAFFKEQTLKNTVVMGRKTFDSIPSKYRPLPDRVNIVFTRRIYPSEKYSPRQDDPSKNLYYVNENNFQEKLNKHLRGEVYVMGGLEIYKLLWDKLSQIYLTEVKTEIEGDIFFPQFENLHRDPKTWSRKIIKSHNQPPYPFDLVLYERKIY
ncbi:MAG: dihydrofolate reductase, partial [Cytophagales bacterium]|nr:dihydrofolate reductase [Cytophagales bacterium]